MVPRAVGLLAAAALVAGCTSTAAPKDGAETTGARCQGVGFSDVRGRVPSYVNGPLRDYDVADAVCAGYWLPRSDRKFVPQSLEIDGTTAYVAGYHWNRIGAERNCQIAVVDTRTGKTEAFVPRWEAPIYRPRPTFCRHAGGMELTRHGLFVVETERLWLLDPEKLGKGDPVVRAWRIASPRRGSTLVVDGGRLGIGRYVRNQRGRIWWFRFSDVMAPGVSVVDRPVRRGWVPAKLQGMGVGPRGVWFSSSSTHCAQLRGPKGRTVIFVPGAEDLEFRGDDLWTISESSAKPYLDGDEDPVPMLLRLDTAQVLAGGKGDCDW